ncbi:ABC-2 transporter permease [Virgibacillus ihumii]|uniref:ABC-2 transporter permease n=1 Tax=Virgibacillus ihumii TaxID=2686091 RepID=UPI00157BD1EE|nr:ABC-2 transporter permease [Virgibacillus ihumii]
MRSLLYKEWVVNQAIIISMAVLLIAGSMFVKMFNDTGQNPIYLAVIFGLMYPFIGDMNENTNKSENLINSLPVNRTEIVTSKYVSALLFGVLVIGITAFLKFFSLFEENQFIELAAALSFIGIFIAVYLPVFYLLGPRFVMIGMAALGLLGFVFIPMLVEAGMENGFWGLADVYREYSNDLLSAILIGITIVALLVSWFISVRLYAKKQF